jgi:outer membrane protein TolC
VAAYRQTVLTGFQEVEDNLAALRILAGEARAQDEAVKAARLSAQLSTNQYQAGTISTIDLLTVLTVARNNERTAVTIQGNRLNASVLLVKALGGGWTSSDLPLGEKRRPENRAAVQTSGPRDYPGGAAMIEAAGGNVGERPTK